MGCMSQNASDLSVLRRALLDGAFLLSAPELGTIVVSGKDRQTWLNGIATCDLAPLKAGQGAFGLAVSKTGKVLSPLYVLLEEQQLLIGAPRDLVEGLISHFDRYVIMEDVELEDASGRVSWAFAHGPASKELPSLARAHGAIAASAVDTSGKGGALFAFETANADGTLRRLEKPSKMVVVGDDAAWEVLRVEIGCPRWGVDFTDENYPQEASIETLAVSFQKGCYLGQEAVFMLQNRGHVKKRLMPLSVTGDEPIPPGASIQLPDGTSVGAITSVTKSPNEPSLFAIGFVKYKHAVAGTSLLVAGRPAVVLG